MKIAHNPETGEYLGLQGGEWKPLKMAQNDAGERLYLDGDAWQPLPGWKKQEPPAQPQAEAPADPVPAPEKPVEKLDLGDAYENLGIDPEDVPDISGAAGYVADTMRNIPGSAMGVAKGLGHVIMHPGQTIDNLGNIVLGYKEKGAKLLNPEEAPGEHEKYADAVNEMVSDRYGSWDKAKETLRTDPMGMALDASMLLGGGGALLKGAGAAGKAAGAANAGANLVKAGQAVSRAGQMIDPVAGAASLVGKPLAPVVGAVKDQVAKIASPEALYARAMKIPPRSVVMPERDLAIEAGLRERIPLTREGLEKAKGKIGEYGKAVQEELVRPEYSSVRIDPLETAIRAEDSALSMFADQARPQADIAAIRRVTDDFLDAHPHPMTLKEAHDIKQGTQHAQSKRAYGERKSAEVEAEKAYARALNEQIWENAPAIRAMNQRIQGLMALVKELPKTISRTGNHGVFNLVGPQGAGAALGASIAGTPGMVVGWGLGKLASSPRVQSELAFALDAARKGYRASAPVRRWMKKAGIPAKYGAYVEARYGGLIGEMERSR